MPPTYVYTSSSAYISSLNFDHIEIYSFQRGAAFEEWKKSTTHEFNVLETRRLKRGLTPDQEDRYAYLKGFNTTQHLIGENGKFHFSASLTHTFKRSDPQVEKIISILKTDAVDVPQWMCAPVYRDAVVFYDEDNKILSVLNICFSCENMATEPFHMVNADVSTYSMLKALFIALGHQIESR
jgi:hypothetical protein